MELVHLRTLSRRYPNVPAAIAELANLEAILTLPAPTVHIVSDVHGEYDKLRQVIHNASGSLRPLVERLLGDGALLPIIYRPLEAWRAQGTRLADFVVRATVVMRALAHRYTLKHVEKIIPDPFDPLFRELLFGKEVGRAPEFVDAMLDPLLRHGRDGELVRMIAHVIRNLAVYELVVAGDLGDRGPRIDRVIELLMQQPNVAITWGNHDADWIAACLGHPAAIATVVRLSLRYQRLAQLEEGYGISLAPLERLAQAAYGDDPAARFTVKGDAPDPLLLARMQKAAAILQFKLEGALFRRRTEWQMEPRALLHRIDPATGTIELDGRRYQLVDTRLPTIDWADPYALSPDERRCLEDLTRSFTESAALWRHVQFLASRGRMWLRRDRCAIFHGCVPVDEHGEFLEFPVDGVPRAGRALLEALDLVVQRAILRRSPDDVDLVFYLWTGPRSPCFGKDKMATFETYFLADKTTYEEAKNPYFKLLHDPAFCAKLLREFGIDDARGFIVNGHVPVKLDQGEQPVKKSGRAITIDGAFAAAYGDKGFSLVLDAERMYLAQHHHLDPGEDIIPTVSDVAVYDKPRRVGDTEQGDELRAEIAALEELIAAFECNLVRPT
ncbi:MAG TPA: fructose-bisphosphatase class III [Kofleriaceae bacterium]|nr:fructose-bisphosphatase class III [Kofleriaceae bacterium]